jgi:hypothetical protein
MPYTAINTPLDISKFPNVEHDISQFPTIDKHVCLAFDHPFAQRQGDVMIAVQCEPDAVLHHRQMFIDNHANFDTILTHDDEILKACPNARLYVWGTTWISPSTYNNIKVGVKKQAISCLTGQKNNTVGQQFRINLYIQQKILNLPITWFRSSRTLSPIPSISQNPLIGDSKDPLFIEYQFSIVIENCRQNNYFTEKLIDCLITKTIPIYYGCPNISNWFDTRGWIILDSTSVSEFKRKCTYLPSYSRYMNVINSNYDRAKQYISLQGNIQRVMNFGN